MLRSSYFPPLPPSSHVSIPHEPEWHDGQARIINGKVYNRCVCALDKKRLSVVWTGRIRWPAFLLPQADWVARHPNSQWWRAGVPEKIIPFSQRSLDFHSFWYLSLGMPIFAYIRNG